MPVDYSKFDQIEDPEATSKAEEDKRVAEEKEKIKKDAADAPPECANCAVSCAKVFKCGQCKKATYCSGKCQKEDWRFHKRVCKKIEEPKKDEDKAPKSEPMRPKTTEVVKDDDDEIGDWYRHREWIPEKKEIFVPTKINADAASAPPSREELKRGSSSAWNAAGTWEDKDMTPWWTERIPEALTDFKHGGSVGLFQVDKVKDVKGEASVVNVRGSEKHLFDFTFNLKFSIKLSGEAGTERVKGKIEFIDVNDEAAKKDHTYPAQVTVDTPGWTEKGKALAEGEFIPALRGKIAEVVSEFHNRR
jgi:hypothetical protein